MREASISRSTTARSLSEGSRKGRLHAGVAPREAKNDAGYTGLPADVAQLVEHFTRNEGVRGSNPRVGLRPGLISGTSRPDPRLALVTGGHVSPGERVPPPLSPSSVARRGGGDLTPRANRFTGRSYHVTRGTIEETTLGVAVKGGMHCPTHGPIAAETTTHGVRNTIAIVGYAATGGISALAGETQGWHCPKCGQPVISQKAVDCWGEQGARRPSPRPSDERRQVGSRGIGTTFRSLC